MKQRVVVCGRAWALALCFASCVAGVAQAQSYPAESQPKEQQKGKGAPQVSDAEVKAAKAVESAADAQTVMAATGGFMKKYPKSTLRPQVARIVAGKIAGVTDPAQRAAAAENFSKVFTLPDEAGIVTSVLVDAYVAAKRYDDVYRVATPAAIEKSEDPLGTMVTLVLTGANLAQQKNVKYVVPSQQLGLRAVEMIEGDKKPAGLDAARWGEYKTKWLPQLYSSLALLSLSGGNAADAGAKLQKAAALKSTDPNTYILLGMLTNDDYQRVAQQHKAAAGAEKDELLKKATALMDQVIESYAHAVALIEGDARYDQTRAQLMQDMESYYKFRHSGSSDGMRQLIDKYKKPAAVQP